MINNKYEKQKLDVFFFFLFENIFNSMGCMVNGLYKNYYLKKVLVLKLHRKSSFTFIVSLPNIVEGGESLTRENQSRQVGLVHVFPSLCVLEVIISHSSVDIINLQA